MVVVGACPGLYEDWIRTRESAAASTTLQLVKAGVASLRLEALTSSPSATRLLLPLGSAWIYYIKKLLSIAESPLKQTGVLVMQKGEEKSCIARLIQRPKVTIIRKILRSYKAKWKITTIKSTEMDNYSKKKLQIDLSNK